LLIFTVPAFSNIKKGGFPWRGTAEKLRFLEQVLRASEPADGALGTPDSAISRRGEVARIGRWNRGLQRAHKRL
jgi:hypothetical protein